jgi:putative transposase
MARKKFSAEQIVAKLREAEVLLGKGQSLAEVCRQLEITDVTFYRWRKEYGGLRVDQAKRRRAIAQVQEVLKLPERRICRVLGQARSTQRQVPSQSVEEDRIRYRITRLAIDYGRCMSSKSSGHVLGVGYGRFDLYPCIETVFGIAKVGCA